MIILEVDKPDEFQKFLKEDLEILSEDFQEKMKTGERNWFVLRLGFCLILGILILLNMYVITDDPKNILNLSNAFAIFLCLYIILRLISDK